MDLPFTEFDQTKDSWTAYVERFERTLIARGIDDDNKKKATFLAAIGPKSYAVVRNLCAPAKPTDKGNTILRGLLE